MGRGTRDTMSDPLQKEPIGMNLLLTNDWHFAAKNPTSRKDDYNAELFAFLHQLHVLVVHFKCTGLVVAGDIFHNKGLAPWPVVIKLLEWGQQVRQTCGVYCISGNHDQTHDRYESIEQTPYGVLVGSGIFTDISRRAVRVGADGPVLYGVPWPDGASPEAFKAIPPQTNLVVAHGFATQDGGERWGTFCHKYDRLAVQAPQVQVWHFGHDHTDHGVFQLSNGAKVVNIGALSRGSLDQDTLTRQVKAVIVMGDPLQEGGWRLKSVDQFALKQAPAEAVFDMDRYRARKEERAQLEEFLASLQSGLTNVLDVDYHSVLEAMALDAPVRARVDEYITRAEMAEAAV